MSIVYNKQDIILFVLGNSCTNLYSIKPIKIPNKNNQKVTIYLYKNNARCFNMTRNSCTMMVTPIQVSSICIVVIIPLFETTRG
jgi:hypothetical protein